MFLLVVLPLARSDNLLPNQVRTSRTRFAGGIPTLFRQRADLASAFAYKAPVFLDGDHPYATTMTTS